MEIKSCFACGDWNFHGKTITWKDIMSQIDVLSRVINSFIFKGKSLNSRKKFKSQSQSSRGVLRKRCFENMQQIYSRTAMPKCDFNKVAQHLYWNHRVFSCKFAAYFQNTFSWEHLWRAAFEEFFTFSFFNYFYMQFQKNAMERFCNTAKQMPFL